MTWLAKSGVAAGLALALAGSAGAAGAPHGKPGTTSVQPALGVPRLASGVNGAVLSRRATLKPLGGAPLHPQGLSGANVPRWRR